MLTFVRIDQTFPLCDIDSIYKVEKKEFRDCLGSEFYKYLKNDLEDYSTVKEFDPDKTYSEGSLAVYKGLIYKALEETNATPSDICFWKLADKFKTACINEFWCLYLGEYLSWCILKNRLPYISTQITKLGTQKKFSDYSKAATDKEVDRLGYAIDRDIAISFENLDEHIKENPSCFLLYKGLDKHGCTKCGKVKKEYIDVYIDGEVYFEKYSVCAGQGECRTIKSRKNRYRVA